MTQAYRDENDVPTLIACSSADGKTPVRLYADPTTHRLLVDNANSSGITSINTDTTAAQVLAVGTSGTDFVIADNGTGTHTFNLPTASASNRGALSSADWTTFNGKGSGTVTSVSVVTANGVSGSVATATTTPAITLTLGAITPTTVNGNTFTTGSSTYTGTAGQTYTFPSTTATVARTDAAQTFTGVQTFSSTIVGSVNGNAATVTTNANLTGAITSSGNATSLGSFSSANLLAALTDETGTGKAVFATSPDFTTGLTLGGVAIPSISSTNTLTNKRVTRRLATTNAPGATPTTNTDNVDVMSFTGLTTAITSMTTNLSGTPVDGDLIEFRFLDNGTARGITWGASFAATTIALPTTTVISTTLRVGFEWSGSTWNCIATA